MNHFLSEKCVTRPSIFNWLWWGSHQKSAKGRSFPFSYLCKKYIISINGIRAFCSYVIMYSQKPILGWYYSSKTYIHAIWIHFFNKLLRETQISLGIRPVWSKSLLCAQWVAKGSVLLQAKTLIRLGGCTGWSESSLGAQSRFIETETGVTWKELIVNIFSWFLYQVKELKKYSLPRRYKTMSENA